MTANFNTSRSRFDEWKRFTGVYQRMGQIAVDSDWNEEVRLRTVDARRRTADVADGSPDDGFRIVSDFVLDPIRSLRGVTVTGLPPGDTRKPVPELRLDRHDPESLPWVIRSRWHTALRRTLGAPLDLTAIPRAGSTPFAATALVVELRLERPPADDELTNVEVVFGDADGTEVRIAATGRGLTPSGWCEIVVAVTDLGALDRTRFTLWGVRGLPPVARTWIGALRAVDGALGDDVVIRGGDGTLTGAGRMLIEGQRAFIERDLRYSAQPDFPGAPPLPPLPAAGAYHFLYLDVWEQTITALDDPSLLEPALDGVDTAARLRLVTQVRALPLIASKAEELLPSATGGGALSTNIPNGALPDRNPPEPLDPCRDRCLFTENASTGEGYIGSDNLHVRVQVMKVGGADVALWSRDNGSSVMALTHPVAATSTSVRVAPADAARLRAGDLVVLEDRATRLRWDAPEPPVLRRLRGVQADTGVLELDEAGATLTIDPSPLVVGGPVGRAFLPEAGACVRRWDGADLLLTGVRYRLSDGITFAFAGSDFRNADYWTFTARVHAPDGEANGVVEMLVASPPHGPVHHYTPLARVAGAPRAIEDLRRRYLPLVEVRDRLKELGDKKFGPGVFVVVVGDGQRTFGDVDQALGDGITGDEALQAALGLLGEAGGSIFVRSGKYQFEHPVLVRAQSSLRILGDGDATVIETRGAGGAFYFDRCGASGEVRLEDLFLAEDPEADVDIGEPDGDVDRPAFLVRTRFDALLEARFSPIAMPAERALGVGDIRVDGGVPDFLGTLGARLKVLGPGEGRVAGSVVATLIELRRLQRLNEGTTLEDLPEAQPLLAALSALPHGVVTIADSRQVRVERCRIENRRGGPNALGVMITGTSAGVAVVDNRIRAAIGVAALPYAPYLANSFIVAFPRAGLSLDGLSVSGNEIRAFGAATTGVHVADGLLSGTAIENNLISGFAVGVLVEDQAEAGRDAATDRLLVRDNRVLDATAVGIQVSGDGVDVVANEVRNAAGDGPFQVGVLLTGHSSRVRECWIEIPAAPALPPVALLAGIVIGEGLDDGTTPSRPVYDVEITDNRVEGTGEATAAIGVVVGGSQPIYDVRLSSNVIRNLGDAAIRTWSTSAPVGRLQVEGNRIERVALGDLAVEAENAPVLERLQPGISAALPAAATTRPRALLAALVDSPLPGVRGPLDAALRWVERLTLRGAVVLAGVDGGRVEGNRISEVGRDVAFAATKVDGAEIRTAAVAVVAAAEVVVVANAIESVRAPYAELPGGPGGDGSTRPEMLDVLGSLGFGASAGRLDRSNVHLAAADLRGRMLAYAAANPDQRPQLRRTLYAPIDAFIGELSQVDGAGTVVESLTREMAKLRTSPTIEEHTVIADAIRASLSQAASLTASDDLAQDAWDAAAQFDLATTREASVIAGAAKRLLARVDTLVHGLPEIVEGTLTASLKQVLEKPESLELAFAAAASLGQVATLRDQQAGKKGLPTTSELVGSRRTIVATFAESAIKQLDAIGKTANQPRIDEIRKAKETLVDQLKGVSEPLAQDLAADFQDVDRTGGRVKPALERLRSTLGRVSELAAGKLANPVLSVDDAARGEAQAKSATIDVYARSLDRQIGGLSSESEESAKKSLLSFQDLMVHLDELVKDQPDLRESAKQATAAVAAAASTEKDRLVQLGIARSALDRLRGKLVDVLPPPIRVEPVRTESLERRLSALGVLALEIGALSGSMLEAALTAYAAHLDRSLDLVHAEAGERQRAHDTQTAARQGLGNAPGPARDQAVHSLLTLVRDVAQRAIATGADDQELIASATLLEALALAHDPAVDGQSRLTNGKAFLASRTTRVSAALVQQAQRLGDASALAALLQGALARVARSGEAPTVDLRAPNYPLDPAPADGIFLAGIERQARVAGNLVTEALSGVVALGADGHAVTEPPDDGMVLEITDNRLAGCPVAGLVARPDGSSKVLIGENRVLGCAGLAALTPDPFGQGVLVATGSGDLLVRGNLFTDNGNTTTRALLHEIAIDWRGSVGVRSNTIRHLGGGAGGAGILILAERVDAALVARLSQAPFLGAEPAPRPLPSGLLGTIRPDTLLSLRELAPTSPLLKSEDVIQLGGLRQTIPTTPILQRALTLEPQEVARPAVAEALADRYVDRARPFVKNPLVDFLKRPPLVFIPPRFVRAQATIQVEGNDVDAAGPALLLLAEGAGLIAANVTANDLRSRGKAGVAYLRRTDSTLFSANRCECLSVVNVVLIRADKAPVSVTGNVLVGAEPVHQLVVPPAVKAPGGAVHLDIDLGGSSLKVPVDSRKLIGTLERKKLLASDAFAEILADIGTAPVPAVRAAATEAAVAEPSLNTLRTEAATTGASRTRLSSVLLSAATREALSASLPSGVPAEVGARTLYGHTAGAEDDPATALRKLVDQVALHVSEPEALRLQVGSVLGAAGGDPVKGLKLFDQNVLGLETSKPTIKDSVDKVSLIHEVLGDVLTAEGGTLRPLAPVPPRVPAPPNPANHSLVVIGGTQVVVVGNAATSGVLVQDAATHVQLNP